MICRVDIESMPMSTDKSLDSEEVGLSILVFIHHPVFKALTFSRQRSICTPKLLSLLTKGARDNLT